MTEIERDRLMPPRVRALAEAIYARACRPPLGGADNSYLSGMASEAILAAKAFDREWERHLDDAYTFPVLDETFA